MSIQDLKMTYSAKISLKYDSTWEQTRGVYDDVVPEEHITFEAPVEDMDTIQLFQFFAKFASAMGHNEVGIAKGACYTAFNEMRSTEAMRKTAEEYDLKLVEDYNDKLWEIEKLEAEVRDLKAKLSRALNPDAENYTDEEIEAMTEEIIAEAFQPTMKTLKDAEVTCHDCGKKYGEYSVGCSSTWEGKCDVCGKVKGITETRDYGYFAKTLYKGMNDK
jgi:hypothetical protein